MIAIMANSKYPLGKHRFALLAMVVFRTKLNKLQTKSIYVAYIMCVYVHYYILPWSGKQVLTFYQIWKY